MANENCENNSWFSCSDKRKNLGWWQLLRLITTSDFNGCPAIRTVQSGYKNSELTKHHISGANDTANDTALATWLSNNPDKTIVHIFNTVASDGTAGITILYR